MKLTEDKTTLVSSVLNLLTLTEELTESYNVSLKKFPFVTQNKVDTLGRVPLY